MAHCCKRGCARDVIPGRSLCAYHAEIHRAAQIRYRRRQKAAPRLAHVQRDCERPSDADMFLPRRRLVTCLICCDLPHRRPATGCPKCGGAFHALATARAAETATILEAGRFG